MYNKETQIEGDQLDLKVLIQQIWSSKLLLFAAPFIITCLTAFYSLTIPNVYQSSVVLEPVETNENSSFGGGLTGLLGNFSSGLSQSVGKTTQALEIMESKDFFERLYTKDEFLIELMAYDPSSETDFIDKSIFDPVNKSWIKKKPTLIESYREFYGENFSKLAPKESPFVTVRIKHRSPLVSKKWLDFILEELDLYMKARDSKISEEAIAFLEARVQQSNQNTKAYLVQMLMLETQKLIETKAESHYAFTVIDSPRVPQFKEGPKRTLICISAAGISFLIILLLVTVLAVLGKKLTFSKAKLWFSLKNI